MITNEVNEFRKIKGQQEHTWQLGYVNETTLRLLGKKKFDYMVRKIISKC